MLIKWKKKWGAAGIYESNRKYWDAAAGEHKPVYEIRDGGRTWDLYHKGVLYECYGKMQYLKEIAQEIEDGNRYRDSDMDRAMATSNGAGMGGVSITAEGNGVAWHVDNDGNMVED